MIDAGTVDLDLAAYLAAVMRRGSSLLVGAVPGGAGKTTVMVALMQFLPDEVTVVPVVDDRALDTAGSAGRRPKRDDGGRTCYLAHEIGDGSYYAYVSFASAGRYFALPRHGHLIATNMHADTLAQTRSMLCARGGVDPADLLAVTLKVYLRVGRGWPPERRVAAAYESDGTADTLMWAHRPETGFGRQAASAVVTEADESALRVLLADLAARGIRKAGAVQAAIDAGLPHE